VGVIVVDMQGDFTTWKEGALAVPGSNESFVRKVEGATRELKEAGFLIFGTQDWHLPDHISFYTNHPGKNPFDVVEVNGRTQVLWPPHCVQGTENAKILLHDELLTAIVRKGQNVRFDSYSGFQDDGGMKTDLDMILQTYHVRSLVVYGIATDYCVKATALDAAAMGYEVVVIGELCRGVAMDTTRQAFDALRGKGIRVVHELDIPSLRKW